MDVQLLRNWLAQERAVQVAAIVIRALEGQGIPALPVKGVILARQLYDTTERPTCDVDLLIRPIHFFRALRVAQSAGWPLVWDSKTLGSVNFVVEDFPVDIATTVGPPGMSAVGVSKMLARASRQDAPLGFVHWHIERYDHLLLLSIDAFKDKLGKGKSWAREDLVRLAESTGFEAAILVERAKEARLQTLLGIVANWVVSEGSSAAWELIRDMVRASHVRSGYARSYCRLVASSVPSPWATWRLAAVTRAASDSVVRRCAALGLGALGTAAFVGHYGSPSANPWQIRRARATPERERQQR